MFMAPARVWLPDGRPCRNPGVRYQLVVAFSAGMRSERERWERAFECFERFAPLGISLDASIFPGVDAFKCFPHRFGYCLPPAFS
jgi:hypothetical protein